MIVRDEHRQRGHRVRLEWGAEGVGVLAADCAVVVVVDVLSFSTCVDVATARGVDVLPMPRRDAAAAEAAGAVLAGPRRSSGPSLSPASLRTLPGGTRLALPSPNGSTLCALAAATGTATVFAGCLRNASAVAAAAAEVAGDGAIGLVPAGERWPDGTLRVAVEDLLGAAAIAAALDGRSPEAELAVAQFRAVADRLPAVLAELSSGRELVADGFAEDVAIAAAHDTSDTAPRLVDGLLRRS
ncbi:2-phosphosulfolactate phosphatase [Pseudonocardia sp. CA-107938]|uniref:2-phosphosulfolactate phosphatase n=1 Tax=Pseudonocardia sp. CA-107938 TaxID=3240021 RepID=UPI003D8B3C2A